MIFYALGMVLLAGAGWTQQTAPCYSNCPQATPSVAGCTTNCQQTVPTSVEMRCRDGYVLQNGMCVRRMEYTCPPGSHLENGQCMITHTEQPTCPVGSELRDGVCVRIYDRVCPYNYRMVNGQCVRSEVLPIVCPPGFHLQNNECVQIECPTDYRLENGWCVATRERQTTTTCTQTCPQGFTISNNVCQPTQPQVVRQVVPQPLPTPTCINPAPIIPAPIIPAPTCGLGYQYVNRQCLREELECPEGTERRGDRCERISCPPPSVWNGQNCIQYITQPSSSNNTNVVNNTHIVHNFNNVTHDTNLNVNNLNNVYIYKGGEVVHVTNGTQPPPQPPIIISAPAPPPSQPCCKVVTPRICKQSSNSRWRCFNRSYQRCGSFCTQPTIQLRPAQPIYRNRVVVMPPNPQVESCGEMNCGGVTNCSGCPTGGQCSPSCYQYSCEGNCEYQDQQSFCEENAGPGCGQQDGCCY